MRAIACLALLCIAAFFGSNALAAADSRLFEVRNVPVDATAAGATEARDQAFAQGQALAFDILLRRLTLKSDWPRLPGAAGQDFKRLISGFAVGGEKRSATRYIANLTYVFVPDRIRAILRGTEIPFSETRSKPVVVLPVLETADGGALLWEPENLWATVWREKHTVQGLVPLIVPQGDPADPAMAAPQTPSWDQIQPLATPHGAAGGLVALLSLRRAGEGLQADVRVTDVGPGRTREWRVSASGPDERAAMEAAVDAVSDAVNEGWKQTTVVREGETSSLTATVSYSGLDGWLRIRRALRGVPNVKEMRVIALAADGAEIEISYVGTSEQLALGLAQQDLSLAAGPDGSYSLAGAAPWAQ